MTKPYHEVVRDPSGRPEENELIKVDSISQFLRKSQALLSKDGNTRAAARKPATRQDDKVLSKFFEKLLAKEPDASKKEKSKSARKPVVASTSPEKRTVASPEKRGSASPDKRGVASPSNRLSVTSGSPRASETRRFSAAKRPGSVEEKPSQS